MGKSSLFTRLTGVGVISSNYPGTTVEFEESTVMVGDKTINVHDLPGTYSLSTDSGDERIVIDMLRDRTNDAIVVVADSTNLESSLVLAMEIMELEVPVILALNKMDLADKRFRISAEKLSGILGVPVVPVSSKTGEGVDGLLKRIAAGEASVSGYRVRYDGHIMGYIQTIMEMDSSVSWGSAVKMLEGLDMFVGRESPEVASYVGRISSEFRKIHGDMLDVHIARDRYGDAHVIAMSVVEPVAGGISRKDRISEMTITPSTGIPILICVLAATFLCLIYAGGLLADVIDSLYTSLTGTFFEDFGREIGGDLGEAIMSGIDGSLGAILGLVIPYIMVFYIVLGILEDSGYLPRAVILLDRSMHKLGLHGNAFIPIMVGFGCNVPAILATRSVRSRRERIILCTIICMAVPCSAQLATITGVTGRYAGAVWVAVIFAVLIAIGFASGAILNRRLKHEPSNLAMELPELQMPGAKNVLLKMWYRTSDFFKLAVPLLVAGSIIIEILMQFSLLEPIVEPMSWLTAGILGLPPVTIIAFIAGILRKEMSYGMLVIL
ncbi:MAG: ferrous iron transport protein B, partial [Candidatus Methanomethylophilaceae archaeon]|nr:ferrous iron transport protein B [Candidatus Methanomethylophilaceae archaeon]